MGMGFLGHPRFVWRCGRHADSLRACRERAEEPIISFHLFKNKLYTSSVLCGLFSGGSFIVASVYIPIFIQGVLGGSATNSGLVLLPMMVGSVVTATVSGFLMSKISYRSIMIPTLILFTGGMVLASTLTAESSRFIVTLYMVLIGLGIGGSFSVLGTAVMHGLSYKQRGMASSTFNFTRSLGMTIGITVFGLIQSRSFTGSLTSGSGVMDTGGLPEGFDLKDPHILLAPETRSLIPSELLKPISDTLASSIAATFAWAIVPAALALLAAALMGRKSWMKRQNCKGRRQPIQQKRQQRKKTNSWSWCLSASGMDRNIKELPARLNAWRQLALPLTLMAPAAISEMNCLLMNKNMTISGMTASSVPAMTIE